ncbi:MAG: molybdopterin molybdotransferase MoeA [Longimicrobiaceae bacterium]
MKADWLSASDALAAVLSRVSRLPAEKRPLLQCNGLVLAEEVTSPLDLPPWDNSAMDGFAVRSEDVHGASRDAPARLRVIGEVYAGGRPETAVEPGTAVRVMTGAPVPAGADGVVRLEHTDAAAGGEVAVFDSSDAGRNIRLRGEDVRRGAAVLEPGGVLSPAALGLAASVGRAQLSVTRPPRVGILATGDELVGVGEFDRVRAGERIVSSNSYLLAAQVEEAGGEPVDLGISPDRPEALRERLEGAKELDLLVTTAGVSVGDRDHLREVFAGMGGKPVFWRVRIRPGSPLAFGILAGVPWFGLPGNPVSSGVTCELFVRPALLRMAGHRAVHRPVVEARFRGRYPGKEGLVHFVRCRLSGGGEEEWLAEPTGPQGSGVLSSLARADALAVVPEEPGSLADGDPVRALLLGGRPYVEEPAF